MTKNTASAGVSPSVLKEKVRVLMKSKAFPTDRQTKLFLISDEKTGCDVLEATGDGAVALLVSIL
jgi:hypothetical protein